MLEPKIKWPYIVLGLIGRPLCSIYVQLKLNASHHLDNYNFDKSHETDQKKKIRESQPYQDFEHGMRRLLFVFEFFIYVYIILTSFLANILTFYLVYLGYSSYLVLICPLGLCNECIKERYQMSKINGTLWEEKHTSLLKYSFGILKAVILGPKKN